MSLSVWVVGLDLCKTRIAHRQLPLSINSYGNACKSHDLGVKSASMISSLSLRSGMSVGLLGGSFDPPHAGHVHITHEALRRFGLDRVIWLVSPGNPLKSHGPAPMRHRMQTARAIMRHPRVMISDIEAQLGTRYTAQTLVALQGRYPGVRFIWLMGADNLAQLHRWKDWHSIVRRVPLGIFARPGDRLSARMSPAARIYRNARLPYGSARALLNRAAPAWCYQNVPMVDLSSRTIRASTVRGCHCG
jgi:nicotinate-nucleotide adenylyltransferase